LLHQEDDDVTEGVRTLLTDEGIDLALDAHIQLVSRKSGESVHVDREQNGVERAIDGSHLLVALGRVPDTKGIGLESAGVELTDRAFLKVNERFRRWRQAFVPSAKSLAARGLLISVLTIFGWSMPGSRAVAG
jgi:pyruvate/2-oxoglutarate dehydrogenase complex dihydrolipoamide dehydrogenase (E3) component